MKVPEFGQKSESLKLRRENVRHRFTPELWARWLARDVPSEGDARRAAGIAEFREALEKHEVL